MLIESDYGWANNGRMESIGGRVRALRTSRHLSQLALAKKLGITQSALSQIENGLTITLSGQVLAGLCEHLTTTSDFILEGADTESGLETAMQIAEVKSIMRKLPAQARETLVSQARLLARATIPGGTVGDPYSGSERRAEKTPVNTERRSTPSEQ